MQRLGGAVLHADDQHAPLGPHLQADVAAVRLQRGHRLDGVVQRVAEQRVHLAGLQEVQLCTVGDVIQLDAAALAHDGALRQQHVQRLVAGLDRGAVDIHRLFQLVQLLGRHPAAQRVQLLADVMALDVDELHRLLGQLHLLALLAHHLLQHHVVPLGVAALQDLTQQEEQQDGGHLVVDAVGSKDARGTVHTKGVEQVDEDVHAQLVAHHDKSHRAPGQCAQIAAVQPPGEGQAAHREQQHEKAQIDPPAPGPVLPIHVIHRILQQLGPPVDDVLHGARSRSIEHRPRCRDAEAQPDAHRRDAPQQKGAQRLGVEVVGHLLPHDGKADLRQQDAGQPHRKALLPLQLPGGGRHARQQFQHIAVAFKQIDDRTHSTNSLPMLRASSSMNSFLRRRLICSFSPLESTTSLPVTVWMCFWLTR